MFFFAKKNQKTFAVGLLAGLVALAAPAALAAPRKAASATLENNGNAVRIVFTDGKSLLVPLRDSIPSKFDNPIISADRRTVAWSEEARLAASYYDAIFLYVYRDGLAVKFIAPNRKAPGSGGCFRGGVTQDWHILADGRQLYQDCAFSHQQPWEYRNLYNLDTGMLLGTVSVDNDTGALPANAPAWAKPPEANNPQ